jgi:fructose-1,6-bisphosphatase/inositol monophosphatase family enzyme
MSWLKLFESIGNRIRTETEDIWGTPEAAEIVGKSDSGDRKKRIDLVADNVALELIKKSGQECIVLSEESGITRFGKNPKQYVFIDPIDGSNNASRGIPEFAVSIALGNGTKLGDLVIGYVYNPISREKWHAVRGEEVCKNDEKIRRAPMEAPELGTVFFEAFPEVKKALRLEMPVLMESKHLRISPVSLALSRIASGAGDAYIDLRGCGRTVDRAAGWLILKEAGGICTDEKGRAFDNQEIGNKITSNVVAARHPDLHAKILKILNG